MRYELIGSTALSDLVRAQHWFGVAAQAAPPGSPERRSAQLNLVLALELTEEYMVHLDSSELFDQVVEQALAESEDGSDEGAGEVPQRLMSLAQLLARRHRRTHQRADLDHAVELARHAVAQVPAGEANEPVMLTVLASLLDQRGLPGDRAAATVTYRQAAVRGLRSNVRWALLAAQHWATRARAEGDWPEAARATRTALRAAARLYEAQPAPSSREFWLAATRDLAGNAADILVKAGRPVDAVTALERGRALIPSAVLAVAGADLDRLQRTDAGLYTRFVAAADAWTRAVAVELSAKPPAPQSVDVSFRIDYDNIRDLAAGRQPAGELTDLSELPDLACHFSGPRVESVERAERALNDVVGEIRQRRGFGGLLRPVRPVDVRRAASDAPMLYLSAGDSDGLALVVRSDGEVRAHPLPGLSRRAVADWYAGLQQAYERRHADASGWPDALDLVTGWLGQRVLAPLLGRLADQSRIRMVATGQLGLLPVHAAWVADASTPTGRRYALDQWVLSYAMNARMVAFARRAARRPADSVLVIDDPRPADQPRQLPWSGVETAAVRGLMPGGEVLAADRATVRDVRGRIARYPVLHLSCHSRSEPARPLDSALTLADGTLRLRDLLDLRLPAARLVVLSACETAVAGTDLPDEVTSFAAGLVQAGAAGVVASAWAVPGLATALLMARFYANWRTGTMAPVEALREAQRWTRDTTNDEKCAYLTDGGQAPLPADVARKLWRAYAIEEPGERSTAGPVDWASFALVGE